MKQGSFAWAMKQLLAGKKVRRNNWDKRDFAVTLNQDGSLIGIDKYGSTGICDGDFNATDWIIWHPPINYPVGTFPWAVEQMKQGKVVRYGNLKYRFDGECFQEFSDGVNWYEVFFDTSEILTTRWEIVK